MNTTEKPFMTLLGLIESTCHPEAHESAYSELIDAARLQPPTLRMQRFKQELRSVIEGRADGLDPKAIFNAAYYEESNDIEFLWRLWRDLYPDEDLPKTDM